MKIALLCCFRNATDHLPEFIRHVAPWVDSLLFLNDRSEYEESEDASEIIGDVEKPVTLLHRITVNGLPFAYESRNRRLLLNEAVSEGADWALTMDCDERLELQFLKDMRGICEGATVPAYSLNVRDLWNTPMQYRTDGVWSTKAKLVLFHLPTLGASVPDGLHKPWLQPDVAAALGYNIYHQGSLTPELRADRVARHEQADPTNKWQADYKYLADEGPSLRIERIPPGRNWY